MHNQRSGLIDELIEEIEAFLVAIAADPSFESGEASTIADTATSLLRLIHDLSLFIVEITFEDDPAIGEVITCLPLNIVMLTDEQKLFIEPRLIVFEKNLAESRKTIVGVRKPNCSNRLSYEHKVSHCKAKFQAEVRFALTMHYP